MRLSHAGMQYVMFLKLPEPPFPLLYEAQVRETALETYEGKCQFSYIL